MNYVTSPSFIVLCVVLLSLGGLGDDCSSPPSLPGGFFNLTRLKTHYPKGTILKFKCRIGYRMSGPSPFIRCIGEHGRGWQLPQFSCNPVACGDPGEAAHTERIGHLWTYPNSVVYKCLEGYTMTSGRAKRYCQGDTTWSGELPTCSIINCTKPDDPENGKAYYTSLTYSSTLRYECFYPMAVKGEDTRICQADGKWSGGTPRCREVDCGKPWQTFITGEVIRLGGTKYGDQIIYKCNNGETESASCDSSGIWYPEPPECMDENKFTTPTTTIRISTTTTTTIATTSPPQSQSRLTKFLCKYRAVKWLCLIG